MQNTKLLFPTFTIQSSSSLVLTATAPDSRIEINDPKDVGKRIEYI